MLLLPATLTSREARVTLRMLKQALQGEGSDGPVVVEAGSLQHLDSAALAVLLEIERLATVAHDLRTPLSTLKALAHTIVERGAAPGDSNAKSIETEVDRLTALITRLLDG